MRKKSKSRVRNKKKFPVKAFAIGAASVLTVTGAGTGFYVYMGKQYETAFFPNTTINGLDVSNKTADEVQDLIASSVDGYRLIIHARGGSTEWITGEEIGLSSVFDENLEDYLDNQDAMNWWKLQENQYEISTMVTYDEEKLAKRIDSLNCFSKIYRKEPKDAYLSDYEPGVGFRIVPEDQGAVLDQEKVAKGIVDAIKNLKTEVYLEDLNVYKKPERTSEDEGLQNTVDTLNRYVNVEVAYQFGDQQEVLNGDTIVNWISVGKDGQVSLRGEDVGAYVKELAAKYDTAYQNKTLKTSYGPTVTVTGGFYGWRIDQAEETNQLMDLIKSGQSQRREPVYSQTANSRGDNDYGDTYVEINLTTQHLFFYKNGKLIVESDFVSGNHSKGYDTPAGAYPLTYTQRDAVLKGENYRTPVKYWMPFNGNIGMHDANWRSSFGGKIYMTNGSHGCINLPPSVAKTIFENITAGVPVLCYHLEVSDNKKASSSEKGTTTPTTAPTQAVTPTPTQAPAPAPTQAPSPTPAPTDAPTPTLPEPTESSSAVPVTAPQNIQGPTNGPGQNPAEESSPMESPAATQPSIGQQTGPSGPGALGDTTQATKPTQPLGPMAP